MKYGLRHLKSLIPDRQYDGTRCPACPRVHDIVLSVTRSMICYIHIHDGKIFYSIDGNFGLCRKRASGSSVHPPLHQQTKFYDQECVDQYVGNYGTIKMSANKV